MDSPTDVLTEDERLLILYGDYWQAAKSLCHRVGIGLAMAKGLVDRYGDEEGLREDVRCEYCGGTGTHRVWKTDQKKTEGV